MLEEHIAKLNPNCALLFANEARNYLNPNNLRNHFWKPLLKMCGITERIRLYDIRASYIDLILLSGLSGKFAQNQAGHEDWDTTYNIYAKNNKDGINAAMVKLDNLFSEKTENNLRINENPPNKKIIPFPKKQLGKGF